MNVLNFEYKLVFDKTLAKIEAGSFTENTIFVLETECPTTIKFYILDTDKLYLVDIKKMVPDVNTICFKIDFTNLDIYIESDHQVISSNKIDSDEN